MDDKKEVSFLQLSTPFISFISFPGHSSLWQSPATGQGSILPPVTIIQLKSFFRSTPPVAISINSLSQLSLDGADQQPTLFKSFYNALKLLWNCSESALKLLWNYETALKLLWNCSEIALELWNCSESALKLLWNYDTALKLLWNCSETQTALKLLWNCSGTALKLLWNSETALKLLWNCSKALKLLWYSSSIC